MRQAPDRETSDAPVWADTNLEPSGPDTEPRIACCAVFLVMRAGLGLASLASAASTCTRADHGPFPHHVFSR